MRQVGNLPHAEAGWQSPHAGGEGSVWGVVMGLLELGPEGWTYLRENRTAV